MLIVVKFNLSFRISIMHLFNFVFSISKNFIHLIFTYYKYNKFIKINKKLFIFINVNINYILLI